MPVGRSASSLARATIRRGPRSPYGTIWLRSSSVCAPALRHVAARSPSLWSEEAGNYDLDQTMITMTTIRGGGGAVKVAVIGAGIMGSGIAQCVAMAGHNVGLHDPSDEQRERAARAIAQSLERFERRGKVGSDEVEATKRRIVLTGSFEQAAAEADAVIEAVPERLETKLEVFAEAIRYARREAVLATNTSQLSISLIGGSLGPDAPRLVGMHFFNPPVMMQLVEIVAGIRTSPEAVAAAEALAAAIGKETVVCRKDTPGFITTRAYAALRLECLRILEEGVATAADIDKALRLGFNLPMGPLELADFNGLDTNLSVMEGLHAAYGERFRPPPLLRTMVAANLLGRKSGVGFFTYEETPGAST